MKILETFNSLPDNNGIYKKTTIYENKDSIKMKLIKTYKKTTIKEKIHKNVLDRKKNWKPFGKALDENNKLVTFLGDEIQIEYKDSEKFSYVNSNLNKDFNIFEDIFIGKNIENPKIKIKNNNKEKYKPTKSLKYKFDKTNKKSNESKEPKLNKTNSNIYSFKPKNVNENIYKKKLFIQNLNQEFREDDIASYIEHLGDIKDIYICRNKYTGVSKGFGFITCYNNKVAQSIIDNFNKKPMGNMIVDIKFAEDKKKN